MGTGVITVPIYVHSHSFPFPFPSWNLVPIPMGFLFLLGIPFQWSSLPCNVKRIGDSDSDTDRQL